MAGRNCFPASTVPSRNVASTAPRRRLLRSLSELRQYRTATAHFETIVDLERYTANVPSFLKGERTLFVAVGSVVAGVDFSRPDPAHSTLKKEEARWCPR